MGRAEKPVDHSRPACGRLAEHLRSWRNSARMTYATLAGLTGLSPATLKRAASGAVVPRRTTVESYVEGCGGGPEAVQAAEELWRRARVEERGRLSGLRHPRPELISDAADLSRSLEAVWEQAGALSLREIRDRSGNPHALPVSSAARIVNRDTIPADTQQLQAFLTGCGITPERHTPWLAAFTKITSSAPGANAAQVSPTPPDAAKARQQAIIRRLHHLNTVDAERRTQGLADHYASTAWRRFLDLLPAPTTDWIIASGMQNYLAAEATRNGTSAQGFKPWQPDFLLTHDGKHMVFEVKSTSNPGRGPQAGGALKSPGKPPCDGGSPAARREADHNPRSPRALGMVSQQRR
ncbi:helix-turn-helix domain-containing protein [Streptomyces xinghaiensis]|uniref:helix-turn-helix domain-containing protein n=1 Tax=Streptomyces xinghaiensis TaxID=1038928 RepID=UPI000BAFE774|nr:helix-turn-helix domain-containing protein [Streptomyces xinghaiensis]MZE76712.1 helix-turn-helix domain-containing protein [Streptomyces sp. SID5475]